MLNILTKFFWVIAIIFLFGGGIYFTIKLRAPQLKLTILFNGLKKDNNDGISPFESLTVSLAARIGVGSLAGIAIAIYFGGSGSIFWIWIIGIITSINAFCETYLGLKFQEKVKDEYIGGPYFYILKGLGNKKLSLLYAFIVIFSYVFGFMTIQANTIAISIHNYFNINVIIIGIILAIISFFSILKGINRIVNITSKLVPIMGIGYILLSLIIIFKNYNMIPTVIHNIIINAFNFKSFGFGVLGTFIIGVQRGVFSTEAGLGTGAIATSTTNTKKHMEVSLSQILGIYFTVFVVCTSTALIILTSNYNNLGIVAANGIELTQYALNYHLGSSGGIVLIIIVICLAYSTIVAGYYYGESALKFIVKDIKKWHLILLKILTVVLLFVGSFSIPSKVWGIVDIFVAILSIINMYALLKLKDNIIENFKKNKYM